jgi:hypothetical protein
MGQTSKIPVMKRSQIMDSEFKKRNGRGGKLELGDAGDSSEF